jgi:hypothetical protein
MVTAELDTIGLAGLGVDYTSDFMRDLHANHRCDLVSAVASTVDMKSLLLFAANRTCT